MIISFLKLSSLQLVNFALPGVLDSLTFSELSGVFNLFPTLDNKAGVRVIPFLKKLLIMQILKSPLTKINIYIIKDNNAHNKLITFIPDENQDHHRMIGARLLKSTSSHDGLR